MSDTTTRVIGVAYFIESRPAPGQPWRSPRTACTEKSDALERLAKRRAQQPSWEHRLMQTVTTSTVSPVCETP